MAATVPCHACGLPRAADLVDTAACPVCGTVGPPPVADEVPEPGGGGPPATAPEVPRPALAPAWVPFTGLVGSVVGFLFGVVVGAAGLHYWQTTASRPGPADRTADGTAGSRPPLAQEVAPMPREVVARGATPAESGGSPGFASPASPETGGPRPPPAQTPPTDTGPAAMTLDNPDGTASPHVRPGGSLTLRGRVKRLVVSGLEAGAVLDCSALDAAEVWVVGPVGGGSRLAVRSADGRVTFEADKGTIGGGSAVEVVAREVGLHGRIDGAGTRVRVRLTGDGSLAFAAVDGPARLEYGRSQPGGPEPTVRRGKEGNGAVVTRVE